MLFNDKWLFSVKIWVYDSFVKLYKGCGDIFNYRIVDYNFEYKNGNREKFEKILTITSIIIFLIGIIIGLIFNMGMIGYVALYLFSYRYIIRSKEMKEQNHDKADTVYWSGFLMCLIFFLLIFVDLFLLIVF